MIFRFCSYEIHGIIIADSSDKAKEMLKEKYGLSSFRVWDATEDDDYDPQYPGIYRF